MDWLPPSTSLINWENILQQDFKHPRSITELNAAAVHKNKLQDRVPEIDYYIGMEKDMQLKTLRY